MHFHHTATHSRRFICKAACSTPFLLNTRGTSFTEGRPGTQTAAEGECLPGHSRQELPWYTEVTAEYVALLRDVTVLREQKARRRPCAHLKKQPDCAEAGSISESGLEIESASA